MLVDDTDSKTDQMRQSVSRKSALTPGARSTPRAWGEAPGLVRRLVAGQAGRKAERGEGEMEDQTVEESLERLTVVALKARLGAAGLSKTGNKAALVERLRAHDAREKVRVPPAACVHASLTAHRRRRSESVQVRDAYGRMGKFVCACRCLS